MKASRDAAIFIDLTFLSPEEEAIIQKVLLRDEDLKKHEIGRVRKLRESVPDPKKVKVLSGEWFEELKSKRYGHQPHASAVVRSSMRWKKSAGPRTNPFLKAMPKDKGEEKNTAHSDVSNDPRSIHPALSPQVQQQTKDAIVLKESLAAVNTPTLKMIEIGSQSGAKLQDQTPIVEPLGLEPMQEWKVEPAVPTEINRKIPDPEKASLKENSRVKNNLEIKPFKIRSFSKAQDTSNWKIHQHGSIDDEFEEPQIKAEVVMNKTNSIETEVTGMPNKSRPDLLMNSRFGFQEEIQSPLPKRSGGVENRVMNITTKQEAPARMEELHTDLTRKDDSVNKNPKTGTVNNVNAQCIKLDQNLDPVQNGKERDFKEILPTDFEQSQTKIVKLGVDFKVEKNSDFLTDPVNDVNTAKYNNWDPKSLDPVHEGKKQPVKEIIVTSFKQSSPTKMAELRVDADVQNNSDFLKEPIDNVNATKCANLDQSLVPAQKEKEQTVEKIDVFKLKSLTKMEEEGVDLDVEKNPDILKGSVNNVNAPKCTKLDQSLDPVHSIKKADEVIILTDFKSRSSTTTEERSVNLDVEKNLFFFVDPIDDVNTGKHVNWVPKSLDLVQKEKESSVKKIKVADFKQRSPTKMIEESSFDLNVQANREFVQDPNTGPVLKDLHEDENRLAHQDRDKLHEMSTTGTTDFDVKFKKSVQTNQKVSKEIGATVETEQEGRFLDQEEECGISNDILASVYARANRSKLDASKTTFSHEPAQKTADVIPTIVIVPSESEKIKELECGKNETPCPKAFVEVAKPGTDTWEDEGVDSDEQSSSDSSHDSDLSRKRGQFSASTLSVTERTASLLSVYSDAGDFGNVIVQGSVEFAIMYSPLRELVIMVEQCQDLAIANPRKQRTDPYVKTYLYPDKRSKRKTSIKKRTVNPVYVESLRYKVKREELHGKTLNLSVWHNDSRGRNAFLGQVEINLKDWDWKHEALTWYNLQPKNVDNQEAQEYRGILCISVKYVPSEATGGTPLSQATGEIHIWLREAKYLPRLKSQGVDSFVKCYMLPDTSKKSRQKTRVMKKTQSPVYNHNMVYDGFRVGEVREACCELTVWDNNKFSNQFLGGVRLSLGTGQSYGKKVDWMDSENGEVEVWSKMMACPNSWVEAELPLRASMTPRKLN